MTGNASQRIALITGATRGIGKATALALAKTGVHVIATGRTTGALEELDDEIIGLGGTATLVELELADRPAMLRLAQSIADRWGRLDVLIANAAIFGPVSPTSHIDEADWDATIDINLSAVWRMIKAFDGLLQKSAAGRAVLVTSAMTGGRAYCAPTAASKAGLEALGKSWAAEVAQTRLKVNILHPGGVATDMYFEVYPGIDPATLPQPDDIAPAFVALASPDCTHNGEIFHARDLNPDYPEPDGDIVPEVTPRG